MSAVTKIIDQYSFLDNRTGIPSDAMPFGVSISWVPEEHRRRLRAYTVLFGYLMNRAKLFRSSSAHDPDDLFEDGDVEFICSALRDAAVGGGVDIHVDGGEKAAGQEKAADQQKRLKEWASQVNFDLKMMRNELKASALGDCVYWLKMDFDTGIPHLSTIDPGFVFLFFDERDENGRPQPRAVIAYEERETLSESRKRIYKREYILKGEICMVTAGWYSYEADNSLDDLKLIEYEKDSQGQDIASRDLDLPFIPLVWVPNMLLDDDHFGISDIAFVLDLIDKIINAGSDLDRSAQTTGYNMLYNENPDAFMMTAAPELETSGSRISGRRYMKAEPGMIFNGKIGVVDSSTSLDALLKYTEFLEEKLLKHTRLGKLLGAKVQAKEIASGVVAKMFLTPLTWKIAVKQLSRRWKYGLLFEMAAEMFRRHGKDEDKRLFKNEYTVSITVHDGLPENEEADLAEALKMIPYVSMETGIELLKPFLFKRGLTEEQLQEEVERIRAEKTAAVDGYFGRIEREIST